MSSVLFLLLFLLVSCLENSFFCSACYWRMRKWIRLCRKILRFCIMHMATGKDIQLVTKNNWNTVLLREGIILHTSKGIFFSVKRFLFEILKCLINEAMISFRNQFNCVFKQNIVLWVLLNWSIKLYLFHFFKLQF